MPEKDVIDWLIADAPCADGVALMNGLAGKLLAAGVPIWRMRSMLSALHPEIFANAIAWTTERGAVAERIPHLVPRTRADSPVGLVQFRGVDEWRCRLATEPPPMKEMDVLLQGGATDYLIFGLTLSGGTRPFLSFATRAPGGFSDAQIDLLRAIRPAFRRAIEIATAYHSTDRLLEVYLGQNAAQRVRRGAVHRGTGETIRAAIWYCDLRGFTSLTDTTPLKELVPVLDRYFECVSGPVADQGGEILKFIGDAMLAVFAITDDPKDSCRRALKAAEGALANMDAYARERAAKGEAPIGLGVALHVGEVMYGNIGGRERLDFTVIGPAVNEVTRVESLCKALGTPLLATEALARTVEDPSLVSLGAHALKGVGHPVEVLTLARYAPAR